MSKAVGYAVIVIAAENYYEAFNVDSVPSRYVTQNGFNAKTRTDSS